MNDMEHSVDAFVSALKNEEKSTATTEKYRRDIVCFVAWLDGRTLNKEQTIAYKHYLQTRYATSSANSMLVALNRYLCFLGREDCRVRLFRVQRSSFRDSGREMSKEEYRQLLLAAKRKKDWRLFYLMQTICSTGIRVSEHRFITVDSLRRGCVRIVNKGKERMIFLQKELCTQLQRYCKDRNIRQGAVFVTKSGKALDRSNIWAMMKRLCELAGVCAEKVFPHNLRHLFALTYYSLEKDIVHLADVLGHSSIETTRIYTMTSREEQSRKLKQLNLLL